MSLGRCGVVATTLLVAPLLLVGCRTTAQFAPSLPQSVGLQVDGDRLQVLTGTPCRQVTRIVVVFSGGQDDRPDRTVLESPTPTTVDRLSVGGEVVADGFEATETLPAGFDWRDHSTIDVGFDGPGSDGGAATSDLEVVKRTGAEHAGDGTASFGDEGWLTPEQIAAGDAKEFLTPCTSDPAKAKG